MKTKNLLNRILAIVAAFVIMLFVGFESTLSISAKAEEPVSIVSENIVVDDEDNDSYFDFADGASINVSPTRLRFVLQQPSAHFDNSFTTQNLERGI